MSEYPNWRKIYVERAGKEIGQALSRRVIRTMIEKLQIAGKDDEGLWLGDFETTGDYDRLTMIAFPGMPEMLDHIIRWNSRSGSWQRGGGLDYEVYVENNQVRIDRAAMLSTSKNVQDTEEERLTYQEDQVNAAIFAREAGFTKVDRQEAKDLLKAIQKAEPL